MNQIVSHQQDTTQQQLALDIFVALDATDTSIVESGTDFHLRKSSLLVDVSELGLLARRVINGVYFLAQANPDAEVHTYDLRYVKWLINYANSNNNTHLKKVIREAQKSSVQVNVIDALNPDDDNWISVPMLGAAGIRKGQFVFKIPSELRSQLRDPARHALLSMRILAGFSSVYALELYERLSIYKDVGQSPVWTLDEFRSMIRVDGLKSANDFRYFRRDILDPAIEQINKDSDIELVLKLQRTGRSYSHISFEIKPTKSLDGATSIAAAKQLYSTLTDEFGLSDVELDEISANRETWTDDRLQTAIEFVRHRCSVSAVQYPAKYLMSALRDGYRVGALEKQATEKRASKAKATAKTAAAYEARLNESPLKAIELPTGEALATTWAAFRQSPHAKLFKALADNYESADTRQRKAFEGFLQAQ